LRVQPVKLVVSSVSTESRLPCRACRAVLFDKLDTAKMHGLDTSNMSSRVMSRRDEPSGMWTLLTLLDFSELYSHMRAERIFQPGD